MKVSDIEMMDASMEEQACSSTAASSTEACVILDREFIIPAHVEPLHKSCCQCNAEINGDQAFIYMLGKHWHEDHFKCKRCGQQLGSNYFAMDREVYCRNCYANVSGDVCLLCKDLIEGFGFVLEGTPFRLHSECRLCSTCSVEIDEKAFQFLSGGPLFCSPNHAAMECQRCKPNVSRKLFYKVKKTKACPCVTEIGLKTSIAFQKERTVCWYQRNLTLPELSKELLSPQLRMAASSPSPCSKNAASLAKIECFEIMNGESTLV